MRHWAKRKRGKYKKLESGKWSRKLHHSFEKLPLLKYPDITTFFCWNFNEHRISDNISLPISIFYTVLISVSYFYISNLKMPMLMPVSHCINRFVYSYTNSKLLCMPEHLPSHWYLIYLMEEYPIYLDLSLA